MDLTVTNFKGFTFDSKSSKDFGVYLTGVTVFDAPVRDVEMITIPGRNGTYARDGGRFDNIEVKFRASAVGDDQTDFATGISNLRNYLCSKTGYKRLEDEYNPDEYRMAVYKSGLEVSPILLEKGTFDITFDCKPQRFLKSGETATSVANNGTISNPTLFDSHPLLQFTSNGSAGTINLGTQQIKVLNAILGMTDLDLSVASSSATGYYFVDVATINNTGVYNTGNTITFYGPKATFKPSDTKVTFSDANANGLTRSGSSGSFTLEATPTTFTAGTSSTVSKTIDITITKSGTSETKTVTCEVIYNGSSTITVRWKSGTYSTYPISTVTDQGNYTGTVDSTKNALSGTIYIDLDIGEAYKIDSGNTVSLNNFVNLGGELPVLPPGSTTVTYTNVSNFKITPRWWTV